MDAYVEKEITEVVSIKRLIGRKTIERKVRYGFLFDMYAWLNMSEQENIALNDIGKWDDTTFILNICFYGAVSACKDRGSKITFTKKSISDFVNKLPYNDFKDIYSTILKSRIMGKSLEEWATKYMQSEDTKKKSGRRTLKTTQSQNSE